MVEEASVAKEFPFGNDLFTYKEDSRTSSGLLAGPVNPMLEWLDSMYSLIAAPIRVSIRRRKDLEPTEVWGTETINEVYIPVTRHANVRLTAAGHCENPISIEVDVEQFDPLLEEMWRIENKLFVVETQSLYQTPGGEVRSVPMYTTYFPHALILCNAVGLKGYDTKLVLRAVHLPGNETDDLLTIRLSQCEFFEDSHDDDLFQVRILESK
jgi:hypothetical protein